MKEFSITLSDNELEKLEEIKKYLDNIDSGGIPCDDSVAIAVLIDSFYRNNKDRIKKIVCSK